MAQVKVHELKRGMRHAVVQDIKQRLARVGFDPGVQENDIFDDGMEEAVKAFQSSRGLEPDGVIGERTKAAMVLAFGEASGGVVPEAQGGSPVEQQEQKPLMKRLLPWLAIAGAGIGGYFLFRQLKPSFSSFQDASVLEGAPGLAGPGEIQVLEGFDEDDNALEGEE